MKLSMTVLYARCVQRGECRIWTGRVTARGYPYVYDPARQAAGKPANLSARIAMWEAKHKGEAPPPSMRIVMTCRERSCMRFEHMALMTHLEASAHARACGAYSSLRRRIANAMTARKNAKLSSEAVEEIVTTGENRWVLAERHSVSVWTIDQVRARRRQKPRTALPNSSVFHQGASLCPSL